MNTTIPAQIVSVVRSAVLTELGEAADQITEASIVYEKERHPENFTAPLARFDAARALLEAIGWSDVQRVIDLGTHRPALVRALEDRLRVERDFLNQRSTESADRDTTERTIEWIEGLLIANSLRGGDA